jgi:hypothetical protein
MYAPATRSEARHEPKHRRLAFTTSVLGLFSIFEVRVLIGRQHQQKVQAKAEANKPKKVSLVKVKFLDET